MRVLNTFRLTDNQKKVIANIVAAESPRVAAQQISGDRNLVAARNELMDLEVITYNNGEATLTDKGMALAKQENVVDASGSLSPDAEQLIYGDQSQNAPQQDMDMEMPPPESDPAMQPKLESYEPFRLMKELLKR